MKIVTFFCFIILTLNLCSQTHVNNAFYFDSDKFELNKSESKKLKTFLNSLDSTKYYFFDLFGYTDSIDTEDYNLKLGKKRTEFVKEFINKNYRINHFYFKEISFGEVNPKVKNDSKENKALNRRVDFCATEVDKDGNFVFKSGQGIKMMINPSYFDSCSNCELEGKLESWIDEKEQLRIRFRQNCQKRISNCWKVIFRVPLDFYPVAKDGKKALVKYLPKSCGDGYGVDSIGIDNLTNEVLLSVRCFSGHVCCGGTNGCAMFYIFPAETETHKSTFNFKRHEDLVLDSLRHKVSCADTLEKLHSIIKYKENYFLYKGDLSEIIPVITIDENAKYLPDQWIEYKIPLSIYKKLRFCDTTLVVKFKGKNLPDSVGIQLVGYDYFLKMEKFKKRKYKNKIPQTENVLEVINDKSIIIDYRKEKIKYKKRKKILKVKIRL